MLHVTHLKSSGSAVAKYLKEGQELSQGDDAADYYGTADSYWLGGLADDLGLTGAEVDPSVLAEMLEGTLPDGTQPDQLQLHKGRRLGEDCTFNAPKSVSLAALAWGDQRVIAAHDAAVQNALTFVQDRLIYARRGKGGEVREDSPRVAIAIHRHIDARPVAGFVAPHLHSHCVIPNIGKRADGSLGGVQVDMGENGDLVKLAGAIYRAKLAESLRNLGIGLRPSVDGFEIATIDDETISRWSPRKEQIDRALAARGTDRAHSTEAQRQAANLATRQAKDSIEPPPEGWPAIWGQAAGELGFTPCYETLAEPDASPMQCAQNALDHTTERAAVFRAPALQAETLRLGCAWYDADTLTNAHVQVAQDACIQVQGQRLTTDQHVASAAYILETVEHGRGTAAPMMNGVSVASWLAAREARQGFAYSADQAAAIRLLVQSRDRISALVGAAGSGKTTAMSAISAAFQGEVLGLAPSHAATAALRESIGRADTLAAFLSRQSASDKPRLIILDESGMVSTRDMAGLLASLGGQDRLLLVGDPKQLSPVSAGVPFAEILERHHAPILSEIRRQQDPAQRRVATLYAQGRGREAAEALMEFVTQTDDLDGAIKRAARAYLEAGDDAVCLASCRATVDTLNERIRDTIRQNCPPSASVTITAAQPVPLTIAQRERASTYEPGATVQRVKGTGRGTQAKVDKVEDGKVILSIGETVSLADMSEWTVLEVFQLDLAVRDRLLVTGDLVALDAAGAKQKLKNGTDLVVQAVTLGGIEVATAKGKRLVIPLSNDALPLAHGWARTVHKAQGQTAGTAIIVDDGMTGARLGYVATSRQRTSLRIFSSDPESLSERISGWGQTAPLTPMDGQAAARMARAQAAGRAYAEQQAREAAEQQTRQAAAEAARLAALDAARLADEERQREQQVAARVFFRP